MKRLLNLFSVCMLLLGLSGVANATIVNYNFAVMADLNSYTSPYSGVTVYTFDAGGPILNWSLLSGEASVRTGTTQDSSAPFGVSTRDTTNYISVRPGLVEGGPNSDGSIEANFLNASYNYFGLWWGSVDSYNTLTFLYDGAAVESFDGSSMANPYAADGNQTEHYTNFYVNFLNLPTFDSFMMTSTDWSFEADNIAVGNVLVPEPMTMLLLGIGLVGLAGVRRKFKK